MKYNYDSNVKLAINPNSWNKNSGKEIVQYAVGGLLYMPAISVKIADKIISGDLEHVKSLVLDLEDSIGDDMVLLGQKTIAEVMNKLSTAFDNGEMTFDKLPLIFIRVREPEQIRDTYKTLGRNMQFITGFNLPKFDKNNCDSYIDAFTSVNESLSCKTGAKLYMMPIIESKPAIERQFRTETLLYVHDALMPVADSVLNIRVGGADFSNVYGIRRSVSDTIYEIGVVGDCLFDIVNVFGMSYVVSAPVWEYFGKDESEEWAVGLKKELRADKLNGFLGKTSIHPSQLPIIQSSMIVRHEDYSDAINVLGMNVNTVGVKKSENGNRMNEAKTHTKWAQKIIGLANIYGVH